MINFKFKTHQVYYANHYPGIEPAKLTALSRELFNTYIDQSVRMGFGVPSMWTDKIMLQFLRWKMEKTTLGWEVDPGNVFGLVTERMLLRWVKDNVRGMSTFPIPYGLQDFNTVKNLFASGVTVWDMKKVINI